MNKISFTKRIANLIVENELGDALNILEETLSNENIGLHKEILLLKRRFNELEHKERMQLSDYSEIQVEKNRLSIALLGINQKFGIQKGGKESVILSQRNLKHLSLNQRGINKHYLLAFMMALLILLVMVLFFNKINYENELTSIKAYYSNIENYVDGSRSRINLYTTELELNNDKIKLLLQKDDNYANLFKEQNKLIVNIEDEVSQLHSKIKKNREEARLGLDERINGTF